MPYILAIDQGTTSSRALIFNEDMKVVASAQQEFEQHFPKSGWVEHEPEDIWQTTLATSREAIAKAGLEASQVSAIGITNQRETTVVWDRDTGKPVHRAIVWQDRRTADFCAGLKSEGQEALVSSKTGLLLDPYFSGTKIAWILDNVEGARAAADRGRLAFGTVDTFLLWRLTGGQVHATDATNASRTLLYNIETGQWDDDLLKLLNVPRALLPDVRDSAADFGQSSPEILGTAIPIAGIAGDQQAATVGQACFSPGMLKSTYGTGCFALLNTGADRIASQNRLLTTVAYQLDGVATYALEGSIFVAGAAVQWLRDGIKIIDDAAQSGALAEASDPNEDVYLVPAFVGLGAPYWDADCRGAMFGLTRNTGPSEFACAALESVAYQTRDLLEAMKQDWETSSSTVLRVDGGMVASEWTMQRLADILDAPVDRPTNLETTAQGAAYLAGRHVGVYPDLKEFSSQWTLERRFEPRMDSKERERKYAGWRDAVSRTLSRTSG
ncbi:MAG: glycerol kinase GlpK [Pseudomonadota bacterium]